MKVAARPIEVGKRDESHQRQRRRIDGRDRDLIGRERKTGCRIVQLRADRREIAETHRCRRHGRILIEEISAAISGVAHHEIRAPIAFIDSWDTNRAADSDAKTLSGVRLLLRGRSRTQLVRGAVER